LDTPDSPHVLQCDQKALLDIKSLSGTRIQLTDESNVLLPICAQSIEEETL